MLGCSPSYTPMSSVMLRAREGRLEADDLLQLQPSDDVARISAWAQESWESELARAVAEKAAAAQLPADARADKKPPKPASLATALWPIVSPLWKRAFAFYSVSIVLAFMGPLILSLAIRLIEDVQTCGLREREARLVNGSADELRSLASTPPEISAACREENNVQVGYIYAGVLLASKCVEAYGQTWHAHLMTRLALRARAGVISLIYRKCLWLSGFGDSESSTGKVQNLMANDAQFFMQFAPMFNNLFAAPVQIIVAFVWLAFLIGPTFLAGLGCMALSVPLQGMIVARYFKYQVKRLKLTDERVKLVNEMVQGMRVIKMYSWETTIQEKINQIRQQELKCVRGQRFLSAGLGVFMTTQPVLVTVVTFSAYSAAGNEMKASVILPAISLFALLRLPLAFLPMLFMQLANLKVALARLTKFLMNEEIPAKAKDPSARASSSSSSSASSPTSKLVVHASVSAVSSDPDAPPIQTLEAADIVDVTPSFDGVCGAATPADAYIRGSFAWPVPDVPAKGKGKGKGKGGKRAAKGGRGGGKGGRGGGGDVELAKSEGDAKESASHAIGSERKEEANQPLDSSVVSSTSGPGIGGGGARRGRGGRGRAARVSKEEPPKPPPPPTLHELDLRFPHGELTIIAGSVGSGKSSLLCALLGEMKPVLARPAVDSAAVPATAAPSSDREKSVGGPTGEVGLHGNAGYFSQRAFILNDTVRGNILLGAPMDEAYYQKVLHACALLPDLEILPGGDMTQIGEKGINLSGGQKARVALARACYARAGTILLDDPLSAVDAHVGKHIFRNVLSTRGLLAGVTRILVTHQTQFLPLADHIVVLESGRVLAHGTYQQLRQSSLDLSAIASLSATDADPDLDSLLGLREAGEEEEASAHKAGNERKERSGSRLVQEEERASGAVSWAMHLAYLNAMGGVCFGIVLLFGIIFERACLVATDFWLTLWIDPSSSPALGEATSNYSRTDLGFWIPIYFGIVLLGGISVYCRSLFMGVVMGLRAAKVVYRRLSAAILSAPMIFFETTPSGRILNRFTSDTQQMDFDMLMQLSQWINCISTVGGALVLICIVNPWFATALPLFAAIYVIVYQVSSAATRDLQRLEAVSRSPIFSQFSETLNGLSTIRAFDATSRFQSQSLSLVSTNTRCFFNQDVASQWVSLRLDLCSAAIAATTVLIPIVGIQMATSMTTSPAAFGLCITYALEMSAFLKFGTKMTLEVQRSMSAVERIFEYVAVASEPEGGLEPPSPQWPTHGRIVASHMCVRYRPELPYALEDVSCTIEPQSKVGIVGRTGSGKTTFVSALWRLVEPVHAHTSKGAGALLIDGTDLSTLELRSLRSRLAIIVQDPVLFNESVRYNLDPFSQHTDEEIQQVLRHAQLSEAISKLERGLQAPVGEAGANFSEGQRQLICLARAMLRRSTIIVLDEATASIDNETDAILQTCIRDVFTSATVLTIAHRLHTIMDSTQILLFDKGALKEHDTPVNLLDNSDSLFAQLVRDTGSAAQHLHDLAIKGAEARAKGRGLK